jgi:hypothetical protein
MEQRDKKFVVIELVLGAELYGAETAADPKKAVAEFVGLMDFFALADLLKMNWSPSRPPAHKIWVECRCEKFMIWCRPGEKVAAAEFVEEDA